MTKDKKSIREKESKLAEMTEKEARIRMNNLGGAIINFISEEFCLVYSGMMQHDKNWARSHYLSMIQIYNKYKLPEMKVIINDMENRFHYLRRK